MQLELIRDSYNSRTTLGKLYINGEYFCETLEDTVRATGIKVKGETAIPEGEYIVKVTLSSRFKREMPILSTDGNYTINLNDIEFKGVRFHGGNTHKDTHGCPLVAKRRIDRETIQGTMEKPLTAKIKEAISKGDSIHLFVTNGAQSE